MQAKMSHDAAVLKAKELATARDVAKDRLNLAQSLLNKARQEEFAAKRALDEATRREAKDKRESDAAERRATRVTNTTPKAPLKKRLLLEPDDDDVIKRNGKKRNTEEELKLLYELMERYGPMARKAGESDTQDDDDSNDADESDNAVFQEEDLDVDDLDVSTMAQKTPRVLTSL